MKNVVIIFLVLLLSSCVVQQKRPTRLQNCIKESKYTLNLKPDVKTKYNDADKRYIKFDKYSKRLSNTNRKNIVAQLEGYNPFKIKKYK
jgi:hypothetical protein